MKTTEPKGILSWCFPWLNPLLIGLVLGYLLAEFNVNHHSQSIEVKDVSTVLKR